MIPGTATEYGLGNLSRIRLALTAPDIERGGVFPSSQPHQNPNDTTAIALKHEQKPGLPHSDRKRGRLPPDHMCRAVLVGPQRRLDSAGYGIHNRGRRFTKTTCTFDDV